jgi:hypothetical protein
LELKNDSAIQETGLNLPRKFSISDSYIPFDLLFFRKGNYGDNEPEITSKVDNGVNLKLHRVNKSKWILVS